MWLTIKAPALSGATKDRMIEEVDTEAGKEYRIEAGTLHDILQTRKQVKITVKELE
jgi:hypothetical protein